jgi:putative transposase
MEKNTGLDSVVPLLGEDWFDPLEAGVRQRIRSFIEAMLESELEAALNRGRYERTGSLQGHRHGHRDRQILGTFGPTTVSVPRARLVEADGTTREWRNRTLPAYKRLTKQAEALIAGTYLAGTNTRRVRRALGALFGGAVGKDTVSRAWRKVQGDWEAWQKRDLSQDDIIRVILDGTVVKVRLDKRSTGISVLVALGVRRDGQKVLLGLRNMGGESEAAWRAFLDDLVARKLATPDLLIIDGAPGLEAALAALWPTVPVQRCTVHTIRTQSSNWYRIVSAPWRRTAQWNDMADLQCVFSDDDALDDELKDGLPLGKRGVLQSCRDAFAKGGEACHHLPRLGALPA